MRNFTWILNAVISIPSVHCPGSSQWQPMMLFQRARKYPELYFRLVVLPHKDAKEITYELIQSVLLKTNIYYVFPAFSEFFEYAQFSEIRYLRTGPIIHGHQRFGHRTGWKHSDVARYEWQRGKYYNNLRYISLRKVWHRLILRDLVSQYWSHDRFLNILQTL